MRIFLFTNGRLQRDRLLSDLENLAHLLHRDIHTCRDLFRSGLPTKFLDEAARGSNKFVDGFDHVHWNADGSGLISYRSGDGLADPPCGVGGKLVATTVFELIHCFHQPNIPLLNEIQELKTAVGILFGDRNNQTQIRLHQLPLGIIGLCISSVDSLECSLQVDTFGLRLVFNGSNLLFDDP